MEKKQIKTYALWILFCEAVGALSAWMSMEGMELYNAVAVKPALSPPSWVFFVVWIILFALMGVSAARISLLPNTKENTRAINLFMIQLAVNFFWPLLFFNAWAFGFAFFWLLLLWALVLAMIIVFAKLDTLASRLQIPYLGWLTFAAYLNAVAWILNK